MAYLACFRVVLPGIFMMFNLCACCFFYNMSLGIMTTVAYPKAAVMKAAYGKRQQKIRNKERQNRDIDEFFILQTMLKKHGANSI